MLTLPLTLGSVQGALFLLKADEANFLALKNLINSSPVSGSVNQFVDAIATKSEADHTRISKIFEFLILIGNLRQSLPIDPISISDFIRLVVRSLESAVQNLKYTPEELQRFTELLTDFLTGKGPLGLTVKANNLLTQNERNFLRVHIISDIRPLFEEEHIGQPIASVVNHSLKIEYAEAGLKKEFFVSLDTSELTKLKQAVKRAEAKTAELKQILRKADVPYIDVCSEVK